MKSSSGKKKAASRRRESVKQERKRRQAALEIQREKAIKVLKKHASRLWRRRDVTGMDVGLQFKNHKLRRPLKYVIRIHVRAKLSGKLLSKRLRIKDFIDGVEVDILERNYRRVSGGPGEEATTYRDPLVGGAAITCDGAATYGTLGIEVTCNGDSYFVTNAHVAQSVGNSVWQPPLSGPGVPTDSSRAVGTVASTQGPDATVDCALIQSDGSRGSDNGVLGLRIDSVFIQGPRLTADDEHTTTVIKVGAGSGSNSIALGVVDNVHAQCQIGSVRMVEQISIVGPAGYCLQGDSGAVLLYLKTKGPPPVYEVLGLIEANHGDGSVAVACHFDDVAKALGITGLGS
jgi:hypothetical protein